MSAGGVREGLTADAPVLTVFRRLLCRECRLSPREAEVVALLYMGVTNQQDIAGELGIARSTVYNTLRSIYNKLDIHIACQLAAYYHQAFVHVEIFLDDYFLVGAVEPAVRLGNLGLLTPARIVTPRWTSADGPRLAAEYTAKQVGTLYNTPGVELTGVSLVLPAWKHILMAGGEAFGAHLAYCSQLVTNALLAAGLTPPDPASASSPAALAAWLDVP